MNILFAASEVYPIAKTGGLADVAGSLPKAMQELGADIRIIMPKYTDKIAHHIKEKLVFIGSSDIYMGDRCKYCGIEEYDLEGIPLYMVDNEEYFKQGYYGYAEDGERFAFFCKAILSALPIIDFKPDVIHCNDWHTALVPVFLKAYYAHDLFYQNIKTIMTIHNLKYQGIFPKEMMEGSLNLSWDNFHSDALEYHDQINFLKGGMLYAEAVTTVSPTYKEEIKTLYYGETLDGVLRKRQGDFYGILNGIDYEVYDPMKDPPMHYSVKSVFRKQMNKKFLQQKAGLPEVAVPIIGVVSRLVEAKGLDLITHIIEELLAHSDMQFVLLGTGDTQYEDFFRALEQKYPSKVSSNILYDEKLARLIYAASDLFLMPSRYEPCGLAQLISLRYGTLPVVRETGGLKDTVIPFNEATGEGNGFSFTHYNAHDMLNVISYALRIYHDKKMRYALIKNAMACDYSWNRTASEYLALYQKLMSR